MRETQLKGDNSNNPSQDYPSSMSNSELEAVSWEEIYSLLLSLSESIRLDYRAEVLVGILRGGVFPALILSDLLNVKNLSMIRIRHYEGVSQTTTEGVLDQPLLSSLEHRKVLLVDDVADTGKSLSIAIDHIKEKEAGKLKCATIYYKPWSAVKPDYYSKETDKWIIFPWELRETINSVLGDFKKRGKTMEEAKDKLLSSGINKKLLELLLREGNAD